MAARRFSARLIGAVCAAIAALALLASPAFADSGSISGTVTSAVTGKPLQGIPVVLSGTGAFTHTDANGHYTFTDVPPGSDYQINFEANGYYDAQTYDGPLSTPGNCQPQQCYFVTVSSGQTTSGIDAAMQLDPSYTITGTVTDASTGAPVLATTGALVRLLTPSGQQVQVTGGNIDSNGTYAFAAPAGTYLVEFGHGDYFTQYYKGSYSQSGATPVTVTAGQLASGIDAAMVPPSTVSGTVTDAATGAPAAGIQVSVGQGGTTTDASGHYSAAVASSGTFIVTFADPSGRLATQFYGGLVPSSATQLSITRPGQALTANQALVSGGDISGTVTVAGTNDPVSFFDHGRDTAGVEAFYLDGTPVPPLGKIGGAVANDGTYTLYGLAPGVPYKLEFGSSAGLYQPSPFADAWYCEAGSPSAGTTVTVSGGATTPGINEALWRPGATAPACAQAPPSATQIGQALATSLTVPGPARSIAAILKSGGYATIFSAPGAGTEKIVWYYLPSGAHLARAQRPVILASGSKTFAGAGSATLMVRLTANGRARLKSSQRIKLTAIGSFAPKHGKSLSKRLTFVIKR